MIGVAIGTYGDLSVWEPLVMRAVVSVENQMMAPHAVRWYHGTDLQEARNGAAHMLIEAGCQWIIFLDGDDELDRHYLTSMYAAIPRDIKPWSILQPSVLNIDDGVERPLFFRETGDIFIDNFLTIGCMHHVDLFQEIGGFSDLPILEDWAYWAHAACLGAKIIHVKDAIYKAHLSTGRVGRNVQSRELSNETARFIRNKYDDLRVEKGLV